MSDWSPRPQDVVLRPGLLGFWDFFDGVDKPAAQQVVNWLQYLNSLLALLGLR